MMRREGALVNPTRRFYRGTGSVQGALTAVDVRGSGSTPDTLQPGRSPLRLGCVPDVLEGTAR